MNCRICSSPDYKSILDLGNIYPSNFVDSDTPITKQPLELVECVNCGLYQLKDTVDLDMMYRQYWYKSSLNKSMVRHLLDLHTEITEVANVQAGDLVLDIGCNDGTLLGFWGSAIKKVGFDPAYNLRDLATEKCNIFVNDYFTAQEFLKSQCKTITSIAMFYDLPNPKQFVQDIKYCLHPDGIWVVQFQDLLSMLKSNAIDNICHEHLEYYSLNILIKLFKEFDLDVFDVKYNNINGGSLRLYVCHSNKREINSSVSFYSLYEEEFLPYCKQNFLRSIEFQRLKLRELILRINLSKEKIYVLGASTKGNTLLQYYGLDNELIHKALEINPDKFGKFTVGTNIPIIPEDVGLLEKPDYLLVLPWHFRDFFVEKLKPYIESGGKLIFPLPSVNVISRIQ